MHLLDAKAPSQGLLRLCLHFYDRKARHTPAPDALFVAMAT
jgi:hypothetical protein